MDKTRKCRLIAFASPKGGVGKSTSCLAVAGALAHAGNKVTILDLDLNRSIEGWRVRFPKVAPSIRVIGLTEDEFLAALKELYYTVEGYLLIDVAGAFSTVTTAAATAADLTISPAKASALDVIEARKLNNEIRLLGDKINKPIKHRLLLNELSGIWPSYQRAMLAQVGKAGVPMFKTFLMQRAPFAEMFLTGLPPHYADTAREPVRNAIEQLDELVAEILAELPAIQQPAQEAA
ncbi:MAG: ParA family protein [Hyphomicrobiaceae bacterium]|jgi:chromosome partitioning protein